MAVLQPSLEYSYEVWNTNSCQAKASEPIQLCECKYKMNVPCDKSVRADLGLKTFKK